eukprot:scaffold30616_cov22-Tisochrysis_lutea.AAC.3
MMAKLQSACCHSESEVEVEVKVKGLSVSENDGQVGTEELPKASGWVPKDVIKVVQAFRHAYKLHFPDWVAWEPLLLLIDEVGAQGPCCALYVCVCACECVRKRVYTSVCVYRAYQKRLPVPIKPRTLQNAVSCMPRTFSRRDSE